MKFDVGICWYCGITGKMTKDHIVPRVKGGKNSSDNLVPSCLLCNGTKGQSDQADFIEFLDFMEKELGTRQMHGLTRRQRRNMKLLFYNISGKRIGI